jgi:hypothetical protein
MSHLVTVNDGLAKIKAISSYFENSKYLRAREEYISFCDALNNPDTSLDKESINTLTFELSKYGALIQELLAKSAEIDLAIQHTSEPVESGTWIYGSECDGVVTHYSIDEDGQISLHVRGVMTDLPLFEQLCVINEIGLYSKWVPFCTDSALLQQIG